MSASLRQIVSFCDRTLRIGEMEDYAGACNGLQVENEGKVSRVAATVDATLPTIKLAIEAGADLLVVHHGLFWGPSHPWTGTRYRQLRLLLENDLAVYSAHLPLDAHPKLGNNARLCANLGFRQLRPFFPSHGTLIGYQTTARVARSQLSRRLRQVTGAEPLLIPGGPQTCRNIGVVTGGAGGDLAVAAAAGVDTFITGEGPHWTYGMAEELGINVFYAGHYATETFGVKALAAEISRRFRVPWLFLDHPTGL